MTGDYTSHPISRREVLQATGAAVAGSLAGCSSDTGGETGIYEKVGEDEYYLPPFSTADHAVDDIRKAFAAIDFGRDRGENFYSPEVGEADVGHMQGVARLPGGWLVQSYSKGLFLTYFPEKTGAGHRPWEDRPDEVETMFPRCLPTEDRGHVGGVHAHHNYVAVPSGGGGEKRVEIFHHDSGAGVTPCAGLSHETTFEVSEYQGGAHYASLLPLPGTEWLLAVGHDGRRLFKPHNVHFYVIPTIAADQGELRYLGRWSRGNTVEDFQSLSLLADTAGIVYLVGTGVRRTAANAHAKLYELDAFRRSDGDPHVEVTRLDERSPRSERNDCNLNAGATFFPTTDGGLAMYCTEKEIRDGSITTREYRDEDA